MSIGNALLYGYPSYALVNYLSKKFPQHAGKIQAAQTAGISADQILKYVTRDDPQEQAAMTEHERTVQRDVSRKRKAALQVLGALGTAGAIGAGIASYASRNRAVQPSQILPAQRTTPPSGAGPTIPVQPTQPRPKPGTPTIGLPQPTQRQAQPKQQAQLPYLQPKGQPPVKGQTSRS